MNNSELTDKTIVCKDCGREFIFTVRDQEFYKEMNFSDPTRCKECRNKRKNSKKSNRD